MSQWENWVRGCLIGVMLSFKLRCKVKGGSDIRHACESRNALHYDNIDKVDPNRGLAIKYESRETYRISPQEAVDRLIYSIS